MVKESSSRDSSIKKRRSKSNVAGDGDQDVDVYKVKIACYKSQGSLIRFVYGRNRWLSKKKKHCPVSQKMTQRFSLKLVKIYARSYSNC